MTYTPQVAMPVVAPPAGGGSYDPALAGTIIATATGTHEQVQIDIDLTAPNHLYAMSGGTVSYYPAGTALPTSGADPSPGAGSIVLQTWGVDVAWQQKALPAGVSPLVTVIYLNVTDSTVQSALQPIVQAMAQPALQLAWDKPNPAATKTDLENRYLERVMAGEFGVFVEGGTLLGDADHVDPTDTTTDIRVTLWCLTGSPAGPGDDLSPVMNIRTMPTYGGPQWTGHPLIDALAQVTEPADIYVRFDVYNASTQLFEPLPAGTGVDLMDYDTVGSDDLRQTQSTDATGAVHFSFADSAQAFSSDNDLYFLAHTNGLSVAGTTIPADWSTRGWLATDGSPGYYPDFAGSRIGDPANPITFRVGVDVHARFGYDNPDYNPPTVPDLDLPAPNGVKVYLRQDGTTGDVLALTTDARGEVHGVTFVLTGGETLYWFTNFEIEPDASIGLKKATIEFTLDGGWTTLTQDEGAPFYPQNNRTSLGEVANPDQVHTKLKDRIASFYVLKTLRELSVFFSQLTGGDWAGIDDLTYDRLAPELPFSWPTGSIHLNNDFYLDRATIWHETSHQVMWIELANSSSSLGIAYQELNPLGALTLTHDVDMKATGMQALVEGWAEFVEQVSKPKPAQAFDCNHLKQAPTVPGQQLPFIDPPLYLLSLPADPAPEATIAPRGTGEEVEGAFANGLLDVVRNIVDGSGSVAVPVTTDGDVTATAPWVNDAAKQTRFRTMIWAPLKALNGATSDLTAHAFIAAIKTNNATDWHTILPQLQQWSMAMMTPTIGSVSPVSGSIAGGTTVTITGDDFPVTNTAVTIGGNAATSVTVTGATSLTAVTPQGSAGAAEVEVTTPAGSAALARGFTYV